MFIKREFGKLSKEEQELLKVNVMCFENYLCKLHDESLPDSVSFYGCKFRVNLISRDMRVVWVSDECKCLFSDLIRRIGEMLLFGVFKSLECEVTGDEASIGGAVLHGFWCAVDVKSKQVWSMGASNDAYPEKS